VCCVSQHLPTYLLNLCCIVDYFGCLQLIVGMLCVMMKQSCPSQDLVEFSSHLLDLVETSVASARFVDFAFIAISTLLLFMGTGITAGIMQPFLGMKVGCGPKLSPITCQDFGAGASAKMRKMVVKHGCMCICAYVADYMWRVHKQLCIHMSCMHLPTPAV